MNQYNIGVIENEIGIISDTHFRHGNIIRYCGRPVRFERKIINNCAFLFKSTKTVVHLGDFGFFNNRKKALWYFDKIFPKDSQKILVIGNHDKRNKSVMRLPWDMKCDTLRFEYNGLKFLCKHRPFGYKRWWQWFFKYDIPDDVDIAIHGGTASTYPMLSGGEKMVVRLATDIGLAMLSFSHCAQKPEIICLDEIFGPLDDAHTGMVFDLLEQLKSKFNRVLETKLVSASHDFKHAMKKVEDDVKEANVLGKYKNLNGRKRSEFLTESIKIVYIDFSNLSSVPPQFKTIFSISISCILFLFLFPILVYNNYIFCPDIYFLIISFYFQNLLITSNNNINYFSRNSRMFSFYCKNCSIFF